MILDMKQVVVELGYRGIVPVENANGTRIDCLRGRLWITEHGSTDDVILEAGESYEISNHGVAVVQALRDALVAFRAPSIRRESEFAAESAATPFRPSCRRRLALV